MSAGGGTVGDASEGILSLLLLLFIIHAGTSMGENGMSDCPMKTGVSGGTLITGPESISLGNASRNLYACLLL